MSADSGWIVVLAAVALVALGPTAAALAGSWSGSLSARALVEALAATLVGWAVWLAVASALAPGLGGGLLLAGGGIAGFAASLVGLIARSTGATIGRSLGFATVWSASVVVPVGLALLSTSDGVLGAGLRTLDLGGALPALVAPGASGVVMLALERGRVGTSDPRAGRARPVFGCAVAVWALWLVWLVGLELAIDELTGQIIVNGMVGPVAAMACWLVVQRVRTATTTPVGAASGLLAGLAGITAGCAYVTTGGAIIVGVVAGTACALTAHAVGGHARPVRALVSALLIGGGVGVVLLGVLASRAGLMFTGQPEVLFAQTASVVGVGVYAAVVTSVLWLVARAITRRPSHARVRDLG